MMMRGGALLVVLCLTFIRSILHCLCAQRSLKCEPHRGVFFEMDPGAAGNKLNVLASDTSR